MNISERIEREDLLNEMKKALDLPDSCQVDIEEPVCSLTANEIINPCGFDLKLGLQVFHYNLRNKAKLSEQILKVDVIPLKIRNEVVTLIEERKHTEARGEFSVKGVTFKMIRVAGGTFLMGSNDGEDDEKPVHEVRVNSFCIGQTLVTQELWEVVMGSNPSPDKGSKKPVERVCWWDCRDFIEKLNILTGMLFRLPTEAEWEFAARGGTLSKGYTYSGSDDIDEVAWYKRNSRTVHNVATKSSNELDIYDMSGNVMEWCQDVYDSKYYSSCIVDNPTGSSKKIGCRVLRGGSWQWNAERCRVADRFWASEDCSLYSGLRLAL